MSETLTIPRPTLRGRPALFRPSIAQFEDHPAQSYQGTSAIWALKLYDPLLFGILQASSVVPSPTQILDVVDAANDQVAYKAEIAERAERCVRVMTTQQMVMILKAGGLPIATIADILDVERKTVYSWLDGVEALAVNHERLRVVHEVLADKQDGALKYYHRLWERTLPGGGSLKALLTAPRIDKERLRDALSFLRPVAERAASTDAQRKSRPFADTAAASSLTLHLQAKL